MATENSIRLLRSDLNRLADCTKTNLTELAAAAGLDPNTDFVDADLRGADLRGQDLRAFDLSNADVRGARLEGCLFDDTRAPNLSSAEFPEPAAYEGSWKIVEKPRRTDLPPDWAVTLMQAIKEADNIFQESKNLEKLVSSAIGFRRSVGLNLLIPKFRKAKPCPSWLREFLLEFSVNLRASDSRELIDDLAKAGLLSPFDELEVLAATATLQEFDARRAGAVAKLSAQYPQNNEVQELLINLSLSDESYEVRRAAIEGLPANEFDEDELKTILLGIFEDDDHQLVQAEALLKLAYFRRVDTKVLELLFF